MKFAFLTYVYPDYARAFYDHRIALASQSYETQYTALAEDSLSWNGALAPAMAPLGFEVMEVISHIKPLQQAWARENGVRWPAISWQTEIPLQQIKCFKPDILVVAAPRAFNRCWIARLRRECPSLRATVGFYCSPSRDIDTVRSHDAVLSCTRGLVEEFSTAGIRSYYFRHGFNKAVLKSLPKRGAVDTKVCFIGNLVRGPGYHLGRERLLETLVDNLKIDIYSPQVSQYVRNDTVKTGLKRVAYLIAMLLRYCGFSEVQLSKLPHLGRAATLSRLPMSQISPKLKSYIKAPVYGLEMFRTLLDSAVALNSHIDMAGNEAANIRLFEVTGVGSCLLTDWKENLHELFEIDREIVAYKSVEECIEKGRWLLENPREREMIAAAGQARTLREHTFDQRAAQLAVVLRRIVCSKSNGD